MVRRQAEPLLLSPHEAPQALASAARALLRGAPAPETEDLIALAQPILRHRMALNFAARAEGHGIDSLIDRMVEAAL